MDRAQIIQTIQDCIQELYGIDGTAEISIEERNTLDNIFRVIYKPQHTPSELTCQMSDKMKQKISKSRKGYKLSEATKERMRQNSQHCNVYQYTKEGKLVGVWNSTREAGRAGYNSSFISKCATGKKPSAYGCIWSYKPLYEQEHNVKITIKKIIGDEEQVLEQVLS